MISPDASTMIGMQSRRASVVASVFVAVAFVVAVGSTGPDQRLIPVLGALTLLALGAAALLVIAGDPMPTVPAAAVAAIPALQVALIYPTLPTRVANALPVTVTLGGGVILCAFLCVRGRVVAAWAGQVTAFVAAGIVVTANSLAWSLTVGIFVSNLAVLVTATFFAYLIRPASKAIFGLRAEQTRIAAESAALEATQIEQATQKSRLDRWARPLLTAIADAQPLASSDIERSGLVEAYLRDGIRARALDVPAIGTAAWRARRRGVEVTLLDDGGLDALDVPSAARSRLHEELASCLDAVASGSVVIRVQPPGRDLVATVVVSDAGEVTSHGFETAWLVS